MAETWIGPEKRQIVYLIIPKLVRECILGIDALKEFSFIINLQDNKITISNLERELHLQYSGGLCKVEEFVKKK